MIGRLADWLRRAKAAPEGAGAPRGPEEMQLAACALLVETALMDGAFDDGERAVIERLVAARFGLSAADSRTLVAEAEAAAARSPQIFGFTDAVKRHFDDAERVALIEMLWEVAWADGELHDYEENLLRRVAGLIYVSDRDRGAARRRVRERLRKARPEGESAEGEHGP